MTASASKRWVLVIGAMRAGTGWTYNYLRSHPSIYCSALKEWHFFDARQDPELKARFEDRLLSRLARVSREVVTAKGGARRIRLKLLRDGAERLLVGNDIGKYREAFLRNCGEKDVIAEITPAYATLDRVGFRQMNELSDDVRFVFIIRNPVDRAWSQICKVRPTGDDSGNESAFLETLEEEKLFRKNNYERTLNELYATAQPERVHVQLFEELFTPAAIMKLCEFMGVAYVEADFTADQRHQTGKTRKMSPEARLRAAQSFSPIYEHFAKVYGERLPASWRKDMEAVRAHEAGRV